MAQPKLLAKIAVKAVPDAQVKMNTGAVLKSMSSTPTLYFVAADFDVAISGVGHETGVWAVDDPDHPSTIAAIDYWAQQVTTWPVGATLTPRVNSADPEVVAATKCLSTAR